MSHSVRPSRLLAVALLGAFTVGTAACGDDPLKASNTAEAVVATVNGKNITGSEFVKVLNQYSLNRMFVKAKQVDKGKVNSGGRAAILSYLIQQRIIDAEFSKRKLEITKEDRKEAKKALLEKLGSEDILKGFSSSYQKQLLEEFSKYS